MADIDPDDFFSELDKRMSTSDDDFDSYVAKRLMDWASRETISFDTLARATHGVNQNMKESAKLDTVQAGPCVSDVQMPSVQQPEVPTLRTKRKQSISPTPPFERSRNEDSGIIQYQEHAEHRSTSPEHRHSESQVPSISLEIGHRQIESTIGGAVEVLEASANHTASLVGLTPGAPAPNVGVVRIVTGPQMPLVPSPQMRTPERRPVAKRRKLEQGSSVRRAKRDDIESGDTGKAYPSASSDVDPLTSPIEDADDLPKPKIKKGLESAPSKLYLEVKERVARHSAIKRQDKLVKLGKNIQETRASSSESSIVSVSSSPIHSRSSSPGPSNGAATARKSRAVVTKTKAAKGKKEKPKSMSPEEYAQMIIANSQASAKGGKNVVKFLAGYVIFYTGGDMCYASERTRGRMDIIVKYGGTLLPKYDRSLVTHIVTDAQLRPTLRALGLKSLKEIPDHVPTIKWNWIVSGIGRAPLFNAEIRNGVMDAVWMHAAFSERMEAGADVDNSFHGPSKTKGKARDTTEISRISEFTQDGSRPPSEPSVHPDSDHGEEAPVTTGGLPSPPSSPTLFPRVGQASTSKTHVFPGKVLDPLAEFYAKAKAERDNEWSRHGETDESDAEESDREGSVAIPKKRGFTCDTKEIQRETCVNQDIIDKLQELMELHKAKVGDEDRWRVFSYSKSIRALRNHPRRVKSLSEARTIRGIGEKTALKIMEIVETGQLRRIGHEKTDDVKSTRLFQGIYGVGQSTAFKWYANGCRTLEDILAGKGGIKLTPAQEIGIRFYDDINDRMPRSEATALFDLIRPIALAIDPKLFVDIMGSYRRGKADCGDIDIMISRPTDDGKTHAGVISRLLDDLHKAGVLTEDLALPEDPHDLEATYRGLCRLPHKASRRRRIDILAVPWSSRGAALIYYTGDDIFNRAIRMKAGVLGYSLNQKGLFGGVVRDPKDRRVKLNAGTLVASETEEEIFRILGVPWQEPHERVRG